MLKYVRGMYKYQPAHIIIDSEEVKYFSANTGLLLGVDRYVTLANKYLVRAVDCVVYSLLVDSKTGLAQYAGFNSKGKFMTIPNITQDELDRNIANLIKLGIVCQLRVDLIGGIVEHLYILRGDSVV